MDRTGTTVISDCWAAYQDLDAQGYTYRTVNHSTGFVDQRAGAHANTIESTWRHVKGDNIYHLAHYKLEAKRRAERMDELTKFLHLAATTDWSICSLLSESGTT